MIFCSLIVLILIVIISFFINTTGILFISIIYSLICSFVYVLLQAHDVCITEVALNVVISTAFLAKFLKINLVSIKESNLNLIKINNFRNFGKTNYLLIILLIGIFFSIDFYFELTNLDFSNFANANLNLYFIKNTFSEIKIQSIVAAILADYRGFDTLIETLVIITGSVGIFFIKKN